MGWPAGLELGGTWGVAYRGFERKRYPCCYMLHKLSGATLALRREAGAELDGLRAAQVRLPNGATKPLIHPCPKSCLNALFSAPYAVLAALADGRIDLQSFTDAAVLRPEIQARLAAVAVVADRSGERRVGNAGGSTCSSRGSPVL